MKVARVSVTFSMLSSSTTSSKPWLPEPAAP
jgi:hypothetical protein